MYGASPVEMMAMDAMMKGLVMCQAFCYSALWLTGTGTALGATATANVPTQITADSDFVVQRMNITAWSAAATIIPDPDYTLLLTLNGSGRQIMDQSQTIQNICGNFSQNKVPSDWPFPYLIQANNTINAALTNRSAVAANRVDLSYIGFKVFYLQNPNGQPTSRQQVFNAL
jgi:hypothetical protein